MLAACGSEPSVIEHDSLEEGPAHAKITLATLRQICHSAGQQHCPNGMYKASAALKVSAPDRVLLLCMPGMRHVLRAIIYGECRDFPSAPGDPKA
jgi:hypothetical protein